jgi:uncharacterized protein YjbI with pentapeptide repeats
MATAAELRQRWYESDGLRLTRAVRDWLLGQGPRPQGLSQVDGRADLRGIPLAASPFTLGDKDNPEAGVHWQSLDLRRAQIDAARFFGSGIENCLFDSASLLDWRLWGTEVTDCSFRRADLRSRGGLGTGDWLGRRNVWRRVAFDRANLADSSFTGCVLVDCSFDTPSKSLTIQDSEVVDCTFRGPANGLIVDGRGHRYPVSPGALAADFSQAEFTDVSITGYVLDRVKLPDQDGLFIARHYPAVYRNAIGWLAAQVDDDAAQGALAYLEYALNAPGAEDSDACFDLRGVNDPELEAAMRRAFEHAQN